MKKFAILLAAALLCGCSASRQAVQLVREVTHDTLFVNRIQYDSIYIDNWQLTDRTRDTIYLEKSHIEYRYKLLRDTVRIHQIDSIPVIREVEIVKTERFVPGIYRASLWLCIALLLAIILFIAKKFFL